MVTSHQYVWMWWQDGGLGWKGCSDHGCVENHPWCEAIIASSLSSCPLHYLNPTSQPITPQSCLSPHFHYSHLTSQKIRVTLGSLPSLPFFFSPPPPLPSFNFSPITPSSLVGIWRVTLGQFNLSSPSATQPAAVPQPLVCGHTSPAGHHSVFYTSHLPCPLLLHRTFHFLICHSCFPFTCLFF